MAGHRQDLCDSESDALLLVEGINDCHAVNQLMWLVYGAAPVFGIRQCGGDEGLLNELAARMVSVGPVQKTLALILDADVEGVIPERIIQSRLDQIKSKVGRYYSLPVVFPKEGLIVSPQSDRQPKLGVWLMPDNSAYGMFEDLLKASLSDQVAGYTTAVVNKAKTDGIAKFRHVHLSKSIIRTYMAWQDPPDVQYLGLAIKRGAFENIETQCQHFIRWLEELFGRPAQ